jgi:hypothetical protein
MAERDELRSAARLAVVAAIMVLSSFVGSKAARDAILLTSFDVEQLPMFVGASAVLSIPFALLAGRLFVRFSPGRLLPPMNLLSAAMLIGEWNLAQYEPSLAAVIVFLHLGLLGAVLVSGFWSIINERFDVQSAKRYVGRIGVGATIGGIAGSLIAERAAVYLETNTILLVLATLQIICALVLRSLAADEPRRRPAPEALAPLAALRTIARTSLLRNLAFVLVFGAIGAACLDFVFKAQVVASGGDMLRFFALYHLGTSMLTALLQLVVAQPVLRGIGVARTVGTLPITVTGFGLAAVFAGGLIPAMLARAAEAAMRSSVFRAGYELLYAPLPDDQKRSTKVVLDVGAERIGDLFGAQIIALVVYLSPLPLAPVLIAATAAGVLAFAFASRVPRAYTAALAHSLVEQTKDEPDVPNVRLDDPLRFTSLGAPSMTETGADMTALSLLGLKASDIRKLDADPVVREVVMPAMRKPPRPRPEPSESIRHDALLDRIGALRSRDVARIREVLGGDITPDLVPHILPLVAWDEVAPLALTALVPIAPRCTGVIVDALLDRDREFTIRRRLPAVLTAGDPELGAWGLWRAIGDPRFEVRYRCGRALLELREAGHALPCEALDIHELVDRELSVEPTVLRSYRLLDGGRDRDDTASAALVHIFNLLGLVLPTEPVRIALQSLHASDRELRATALEYLESALPPPLADKLWPLLDEARPTRSARTREELAVALRMSQPQIAKLGHEG